MKKYKKKRKNKVQIMQHPGNPNYLYVIEKTEEGCLYKAIGSTFRNKNMFLFGGKQIASEYQAKRFIPASPQKIKEIACWAEGFEPK